MQKRAVFYYLVGIIFVNFVYSAIADDISTKNITYKDQYVRGTTHRFINERDLKVVSDAPTYIPLLSEKIKGLQKPARPNAPLTESTSLDLYLPAGSHLAVQFDHQNKLLSLILPVSSA